MLLTAYQRRYLASPQKAHDIPSQRHHPYPEPAKPPLDSLNQQPQVSIHLRKASPIPNTPLKDPHHHHPAAGHSSPSSPTAPVITASPPPRGASARSTASSQKQSPHHAQQNPPSQLKQTLDVSDIFCVDPRVELRYNAHHDSRNANCSRLNKIKRFTPLRGIQTST